MIYGIGTDIVRVERMRENLDRWGDRFAQRILTETELVDFSNAPDPSHFLAKRFAAKEAAAKALGVGFSTGLSPRHIGVTHDARGRPLLEYTERAAELCRELHIEHSHVSIADERDHAVAFVTLLAG
jgi:holo-[acyl-carrier protein] synthase